MSRAQAETKAAAARAKQTPGHLFTVDNYPEPFATKEQANSYAKTASMMFGKSMIVVRYDGFAVENFYQGKKTSEGGEGFKLQGAPATQPKRATFTSTKATQRVLLTGLDCLAGQSSLFDTDGSN